MIDIVTEKLREAHRQVLAGDEGSGHFADVVKAIDWNHAPPELMREAIDMALEVGAHLTARDLSQRAHQLHPDDDALGYLAHVLAAPRIVGKRRTETTKRETMLWLDQHSSDYKGEWVAVRQGRLLEHADTLDMLLSLLGDEFPDPQILITQVI